MKYRKPASAPRGYLEVPTREIIISLHSCPICLEDFPEFQRQNSLRESSCPEGARDREEGRPQQDTRRAMELRCGHQFCLQCLEQYLRAQKVRSVLSADNLWTLVIHHPQTGCIVRVEGSMKVVRAVQTSQVIETSLRFVVHFDVVKGLK